MAAKSLKYLIQHEAYTLVFLQLMGVVLLAVAALPIRGVNSGFSVLMGGLAYGLPNLFFVWRVFRFVGAQQVMQFIAAFFIGEMIKMILSALLFLLVVKYLPVSLLSVLVGFIGAMVSFWLGCLWYFSGRNVSSKQLRSG